MGKLVKKSKRTEGFILLDALIALIIASVTFIVVLANITMAGRNTKLMKERIYMIIEQKNQYENERQIQFFKE